MTGFLSRVAARAVGEAPLARPKLPARFEGTPSEAGLEIVDIEVPAAPLSRSESREVAPQGARAPNPATAEPGPVAATARRREPAPAESETPAAPAFAPRVAERAAEPAPSTREASPSRSIEVFPAEAAPIPAATAVPAASPVSVTTTVRATAAVPVTPPVLALRAPARAHASVASAAAEPLAIRVHIGRLEVRANLQEAPPQRPSRRAETAPPGPSLSDYLRGRRTAG